MTDTNPTRRRYAENKSAFTEVLGDPFAPEPVDGWYNTFRNASSNRSVESRLGEGRGAPNPARPSQIDFFVDVDNAVRTVITTPTLLQRFATTYIVGDIESPDTLRQDERNRLEQRIGKLFLALKIAPVGKYFQTIRHTAAGRKG